MIFDTLNTEQRSVVLELKDFLTTRKEIEVVVEGPAGSGKTHCMRALVEQVKKRIIFTAPTNKAVRVLRDAIKSEDYTPRCKTIYSLLGLQLMPDGEVKVLKEPDDPVDLSEFSAVVVDEGSMVNSVLRGHIKQAQVIYPQLKWIFLEDAYQLPPVGEDRSPIAEIKDRLVLRTVMRHDNTILDLANHLRTLIEAPNRALGERKDTADVRWLNAADLAIHMRENASMFLSGWAKAIAWRNVKVDEYNRLIRKVLFAEPEAYPWQPGDRITTEEPFKDLEQKDRVLALTSDEGSVERAEQVYHPIYQGMLCWRILFRKDDNQVVTLWALHRDSLGAYEREKARLAREAKVNRRLWYQFWEFVEAFSKVRHAYAITAHKSQGSTYDRVYVDWRDVMRNPDRLEGYKCFYVAVTRARKEVYLG